MGCVYSKSALKAEPEPVVPVVDKDADGLSYVGAAVYQVLQEKHSKYHDSQWNVTKSKMIGSIQHTPNASLFKTGEEPPEEHSNWLAIKMCEIVAKTTTWCDVMSLAAPDGFFLEQMKQAVKKVCENSKAAEKPVVIRMMFGNIIGVPINCEKLMKKLTEDLPEDKNIVLWVGAWRYGATWNHAKLIAVDGKYVHTGGHNMWSDIYLNKDPIHDVSLEMEGDVAHDAHLFANEQWKFIEEKQATWIGQMLENMPDFLPLASKTRVIISEYPKDTATEFAPYYDRSLVSEHSTPEGSVPVISIGRQGTLTDTDRPADDAIIAMIESSKTIIKMSLQDVGPITLPGKIPLPGTGWPKSYLDALARAIWLRGVDVEIILTNVGARRGYSNGWSANDVGSEIIKRIERQFPNASDVELRKKVDDNLRICYLRHAKKNTHTSGVEIGNHSKYFIVDDICSYTGSQNLYVCDLAEWGVIIDDSEKTFQMLEDLWNPMWEASFLESDCEVQEVMDGLKIDRDGEQVDATSSDGRKQLEAAAVAVAVRGLLPPDTELYDEE